MIPGCSRNCRRTSKTMAPAARVTALIARPEKRNTTAAPSRRPTSVVGVTIWVLNMSCTNWLGGLGDLVRVEQVLDRGAPCVGERPEQGGRRQHRGGDGDALGDRLGGVADGVEVGEDPRALGVDVAGHLGDALSVVGDRAEGVHRDDDADRGEQAGTSHRHEEQRQSDRAATEQERSVDRRPDDDRGVDRRLEPDADAGEDHGGGAGARGPGDVAGGPLVGAGEVAGEPQDDRGQDDAEDDGDSGADAQPVRRRRQRPRWRHPRSRGMRSAGTGRPRRRTGPPR